MIEHTIRRVDFENKTLNRHITAMAKGCEWQLAKAVKAFSDMDARLAEEVVKSDRKLNELNLAVEEEASLVIARRQPVARDLRFLVSVMIISSEFERIGDYAANIAKRAARLCEKGFNRHVELILEMARTCRAMINKVLDAFTGQDVDLAIEVWHKDDVVDRQFARLVVQLKRAAQADPDLVESYADLIFIGKCCERVGDHVTNIAENIHYIKTGKTYPGPEA